MKRFILPVSLCAVLVVFAAFVGGLPWVIH
jgi:hypothetical protein